VRGRPERGENLLASLMKGVFIPEQRGQEGAGKKDEKLQNSANGKTREMPN